MVQIHSPDYLRWNGSGEDECSALAFAKRRAAVAISWIRMFFKERAHFQNVAIQFIVFPSDDIEGHLLAFIEESVVEAEMKRTRTCMSLDQHTYNRLFCSRANKTCVTGGPNNCSRVADDPEVGASVNSTALIVTIRQRLAVLLV
jgi:hypothetical protein